jgi:hypothetical protein
VAISGRRSEMPTEPVIRSTSLCAKCRQVTSFSPSSIRASGYRNRSFLLLGRPEAARVRLRWPALGERWLESQSPIHSAHE